MSEATLKQVAARFSRIYAIISPPRCSSTALARMFWEQPSVRYYSHEPFETTYYQGADLSAVVEALRQPLDLCIDYKPDTGGRALVLKEMVYQVGPRIDQLLALATAPVIFLIRDPRLNISSRVAKKVEGGTSPHFPTIETGWELLAKQVGRAEALGVPHLILDATDFRDHPERVFPALFKRLDLPYSPAMLRWRTGAHLDLDNLGGPHRHLYRRVLQSRAIQPATEPVPTIASFAHNEALRAHVLSCMAIYRALQGSPARLRAAPGAEPDPSLPLSPGEP